MTETLHRDRQHAWTFALVGGFVAAALVIGNNLYTGLDTELSLNGVLVGGFVTGFLVARASARTDVGRAAIGAGLLGGSPALAWFLPPLVDFVVSGDDTVSYSLLEAAFVLLFVGVHLVFTALIGLLGGLVGRWVFEHQSLVGATHG
ncbi:DUF5518 domain-containing protein [Haloarchaeobius salinus]|uniref:DUF5518 domain-containing protein n=1 Tax=Haloarchaeobius salinus TaxID=1198298 RepID=UPI002108A33F|nr:DUF5518 domain-containing protein [Haloarchaeobius salinus]